jgi:hypothetical protein
MQLPVFAHAPVMAVDRGACIDALVLVSLSMR